jgi:hypothetical protein
MKPRTITDIQQSPTSATGESYTPEMEDPKSITGDARMLKKTLFICLILAVTSGSQAWSVPLPDEAQNTTFTANVSEQVDVTLPASISFSVPNINVESSSDPQTVSVTNAILMDGRKLRLEIAPLWEWFDLPINGLGDYAASDVSWTGTWTNGTANNTSMSATPGAYVKLVDMTNANASSLSCTDLVFTLSAKPEINAAGQYQMPITWRISSF